MMSQPYHGLIIITLVFVFIAASYQDQIEKNTEDNIVAKRRIFGTLLKGQGTISYCTFMFFKLTSFSCQLIGIIENEKYTHSSIWKVDMVTGSGFCFSESFCDKVYPIQMKFGM